MTEVVKDLREYRISKWLAARSWWTHENVFPTNELFNYDCLLKTQFWIVENTSTIHNRSFNHLSRPRLHDRSSTRVQSCTWSHTLYRKSCELLSFWSLIGAASIPALARGMLAIVTRPSLRPAHFRPWKIAWLARLMSPQGVARDKGIRLSIVIVIGDFKETTTDFATVQRWEHHWTHPSSDACSQGDGSAWVEGDATPAAATKGGESDALRPIARAWGVTPARLYVACAARRQHCRRKA